MKIVVCYVNVEVGELLLAFNIIMSDCSTLLLLFLLALCYSFPVLWFQIEYNTIPEKFSNMINCGLQ